MKRWLGMLLGAVVGMLLTGACLFAAALVWSTLTGLQEPPAPTALSVGSEPTPPVDAPDLRATPPTAATGPLLGEATGPAPAPGQRGSGGLPVTRLSLQSPYEAQGFAFQPADLGDGRLRWVAASPDGLALVEIVGAEQVEQASITTFGSANADAGQAAQQIVHMLIMLNAIFPGWSDGVEWFSDELVASARQSGDYAADIAHAGVRIELAMEAELGALTLSFQSE